MSLESLTYKSVANISYHQVEMLEDRGCRRKVEIIHLGNGQTEIDQLVVAAVETWQDGVVVVYPSLHVVLYVEVHHARAADGDVISVGKHLYIGVLYQFLPDSFLRRCGEIEDIAILLHNLKDADFRKVAVARSESHLVVVAQEIKCFLHHDRLPIKWFLKDVAVGHGAVGLGEGIGLVLDAEHRQVLTARILKRTLAIGSHTDDGALANGENLTIHLILTFTLQDNVKFLVSLVGVQETTVLTRNERLETQFAASCTYRLTSEHLALMR